jgi:hypothetical protein
MSYVRITTAAGAIAVAVCLLPPSAPGRADDPATVAAEKLFTLEVLPLLKSKCLACHGEKRDDIQGGFDLTTREGLLKGGESETPSVVPGKPESSPLISAVKWLDLEMPPKENDRLTAEQIALLEKWVAAGAPWPDEAAQKQHLASEWSKTETKDGLIVATSGGLADEWTYRRYLPENLWAYRPLWRDESRRLNQSGRNPIDVLLGDKLAELKLDPAPPADRATLIRRVTFDLTGLPPTPEEIAAFVNDPAAEDAAFAAVVERLLASPHYGEQWGRHWLDVVRYADSSGYANDYERGAAWRYRDYVIRAFNEDKPYDEFIREQIAGDEMVEGRGSRGDGEKKDGETPDSELLVAAGFLRMGPWELTGMEVAKVARQRFLDDVTDGVGQVFLAHMLQCARCHDHKFDPIPTRDYYSFQAIFATTQFAERPADFLPQENTAGFDERKYLLERQAFYERTLKELDAKQTLAAARQWLADEGRDAAPFEAAVAELAQQGKSRGSELDAVRKLMQEHKVSPDLIPPRHVGFVPADFGLERVSRKGLERLKWRLQRYEPLAFTVYSGLTPEFKAVTSPLKMPQARLTDGELEATCILVGGDPFSPSQPVTPASLSVVDRWGKEVGGQRSEVRGQGSDGEASAGPDTQHSTLNTQPPVTGRRLELADWIATPDNPLTARVMVNRVWQWHFGQALAGNPNNFGTTGKKPTHPELLDWLAGTFVERGWSVKELHRLILTSDAYRRASTHPDPAAVAERDPLGTSYALFRPRRLTAEELRDAMLSVSGELNPALGGIPARPEMNLEAALQPRQVMGTFAEAWQPSPLPEQRHRRSIYALRIRGQRDPFFEVFNAPSPDLSCEAREASTVTPQVFAMFNSEITFDRALAMADRLVKESRSREETIARAFELASGRHASKAEVTACLTHWDAMTARHRTLKFDPPAYPREITREAVEENTGEKFRFTEPLEAYADFVPDLKPSDATPEVRGLAEVCLVILNSNEFAYVY